MSTFNCLLLNVGLFPPTFNCWHFDCQVLAVGFQLTVFNCQLLTVDLVSAFNCLLLIVGLLPPTADNLAVTPPSFSRHLSPSAIDADLSAYTPLFATHPTFLSKPLALHFCQLAIHHNSPMPTNPTSLSDSPPSTYPVPLVYLPSRIPLLALHANTPPPFGSVAFFRQIFIPFLFQVFLYTHTTFFWKWL